MRPAAADAATPLLLFVADRRSGPARRMAENLVEQLLELMPELKEVSPWHSVGQRRSLDEMGRIAENQIGDPRMYCPDAYE